MTGSVSLAIANQVRSHAEHASASPALSLWISVVAVALTATTFVTNSWRGRRDLLLEVHERLTSIEQQRARRLLHQMSEAGTKVEDLKPDDRGEINNSLAFLNTVVIYYQRRYIPRKTLLQMWAVPVLRLMPGAERFIEYRNAEAGEGARTWQEIHDFKAIAVKYVRRTGRQGEVGQVWPAVAASVKPRRSLSGLARRLGRCVLDWWRNE